MTTPTDPPTLIAKAREISSIEPGTMWNQLGDYVEISGDGWDMSIDCGGSNDFARFIATARTLVPALADALENMTGEWERTEQSATSYRQSLRSCRRELADHKAKMVGLLADAYAKGRAFGRDEDDRDSEDD